MHCKHFGRKKHGINAPPVQKLIKSFLMCVTPLLPLFAVGGSEVDVQTEHLSNKTFRIKRFPQNPEVLKIQKIPVVLVRAPTITNLKACACFITLNQLFLPSLK